MEKASLLGISLGAWLSIKFSVGYPDKVNLFARLRPRGHEEGERFMKRYDTGEVK